MVDKIVEEMNKALENNLYLAALSLVLTLPDICGKAAYTNKRTGDRYRDWFDEYVDPHNSSTKGQENDSKFPCLTG